MSDTSDGGSPRLPYTEPLMRDHGSLMDLTGKSGESIDKIIKDDVEKGTKDATDKLKKEGAEKGAKDAIDNKGAGL